MSSFVSRRATAVMSVGVIVWVSLPVESVSEKGFGVIFGWALVTRFLYDASCVEFVDVVVSRCLRNI
jgi:hypothetical protein